MLDRALALQHPHLRPLRGVHLGREHALHVYEPSEAPTLSEWIAREAPQGIRALPLARELIDQVCQAVAVAHRGGFAHGGVAPWCVRVESRGGRALARVEAVGAAFLAPVAEIERLAPELDPRAIEPSARADVFALGGLLATLLVGAEGAAARIAQRLESERPELDASLRELVRRCLEADPEARPADASRVRELLRKASWSARSIAPPRTPPRRADPDPAAFERATPSPSPPRAPVEAHVPWSEETEVSGLLAPPPDTLEGTSPEVILPPPEEPASSYATLKTPRRQRAESPAPQRDHTRAIEAPPPDAPTDHTRAIALPPSEPPADHTRAIALPPSEPPIDHTRAIALPAAPMTPAHVVQAQSDWDAPRSSFHVIPSSARPPMSLAPPPSMAPLPTDSDPVDRSALGVAAVVLGVLLAALFFALTR